MAGWFGVELLVIFHDPFQQTWSDVVEAKIILVWFRDVVEYQVWHVWVLDLFVCEHFFKVAVGLLHRKVWGN